MWNVVVDICLKILGIFINKVADNTEVQKKFLEFVNSLEEKQLISAKVGNSYKEQLERLKK